MFRMTERQSGHAELPCSTVRGQTFQFSHGSRTLYSCVTVAHTYAYVRIHANLENAYVGAYKRSLFCIMNSHQGFCSHVPYVRALTAYIAYIRTIRKTGAYCVYLDFAYAVCATVTQLYCSTVLFFILLPSSISLQ